MKSVITWHHLIPRLGDSSSGMLPNVFRSPSLSPLASAILLWDCVLLREGGGQLCEEIERDRLPPTFSAGYEPKVLTAGKPRLHCFINDITTNSTVSKATTFHVFQLISTAQRQLGPINRLNRLQQDERTHHKGAERRHRGRAGPSILAKSLSKGGSAPVKNKGPTPLSVADSRLYDHTTPAGPHVPNGPDTPLEGGGAAGEARECVWEKALGCGLAAFLEQLAG